MIESNTGAVVRCGEESDPGDQRFHQVRTTEQSEPNSLLVIDHMLQVPERLNKCAIRSKFRPRDLNITTSCNSNSKQFRSVHVQGK